MKFGELLNTCEVVLVAFTLEEEEGYEVINRMLTDVSAAMGDTASVVNLSVQKNKDLAASLKILKVPTYIIYRKKELIWRQSDSGIDMKTNTLVGLLRQNV